MSKRWSSERVQILRSEIKKHDRNNMIQEQKRILKNTKIWRKVKEALDTNGLWARD